MSKWEFLELNSKGEPVPFSGSKAMPWIQYALESAANSKVPDPKFSQYYVNCSCVVLDKTSNIAFSCQATVQGGNTEYGLCQALHGEESLVTALKSVMGDNYKSINTYTVIIAFASRFETGKVPTCCGNCRDIMRDTLPLNTMIFGGHPNGGKVIVAHLWDLLGDDYQRSKTVYSGGDFLEEEAKRKLGSLNAIEVMVGDCLELQNDIYFPGKPNPGRSYVAIIGRPGQTYLGAHDVMCDYHPIYAVRDAVRQVRRDPGRMLLFSYALVASRFYFPDVMYKDRQHLLELNFQQECLIGREMDPPVYLAMYELEDGEIKIKRIVKTSVKKWLPFAFSPANFGKEFVQEATAKFKKMRQ